MAAEGRNGEVSTQGEYTDPNTNTGGYSFDDLAKGLAHGKLTRRKALRMLGATLLGGVLASVPSVAWAAKPSCPSGKKCGKNCCPDTSFVCTQGKCACPSGTVLCNNACVSNVCDSTTGEVFNPATCKCECPMGEEICPGNNTCVSNACGVGQTFNLTTCECEQAVCPGDCSNYPICGPPDPVTGFACHCFQVAMTGVCGCARTTGSCSDLTPCTTSDQCPTGSVCAVGTGCDATYGSGICLKSCS
jgi:hypothetical protein